MHRLYSIRSGRRAAIPFALGIGILSLVQPCVMQAKPPALGSAARSGAAVQAQSPALAPDATLNPCVTLQVKSLTLGRLLQTLTLQTGAQLQVTPDLAGRRVSVFAERLPLRRLMWAIVTTTRLAWRKLDSGGYQLYQTPDEYKLEQQAVQDAKRWEQAAQQAKRQALLDAIHHALNSNNHSAVTGLLADMSPDQLQQAADLAAQPPQIGDSGSQSAFYSQFMGAAPFKSLSNQEQQRIRASVGGLAAHFAKPSGGLSDSQVGVVGADGTVWLGILGPGNADLWVSPTDDVHRNGLSGIDTPDDSDAELDPFLGKARVNYLQQPSMTLYHQPLHFPSSVQRNILTDLMQSVAKQTGLAVVCDDFLRSGQTYYFWLLTYQPSYPLNVALRQIAHTYIHEMFYRKGMLSVRTAAPGPDLNSEPPESLLERLRILSKTQGHYSLSDFLALGALTQDQLNLLNIHHISGINRGFALLYAQRLHAQLRLLSLLTPAQLQQAEEKTGLAPNEMSKEELAYFRMIAVEGLPARIPAAQAPQRAGIYLQDEGIKRPITIELVSEGKPGYVTIYTLPRV